MQQPLLSQPISRVVRSGSAPAEICHCRRRRECYPPPSTDTRSVLVFVTRRATLPGWSALWRSRRRGCRTCRRRRRRGRSMRHLRRRCRCRMRRRRRRRRRTHHLRRGRGGCMRWRRRRRRMDDLRRRRRRWWRWCCTRRRSRRRRGTRDLWRRRHVRRFPHHWRCGMRLRRRCGAGGRGRMGGLWRRADTHRTMHRRRRRFARRL